MESQGPGGGVRREGLEGDYVVGEVPGFAFVTAVRGA
jgi:hypothetical protein